MSVYMVREALVKEKPKYMKQQTLQDMFRRITNKNAQQHRSSIQNPLPSTSSAPDITDDDPDVPQDNPDSPDVDLPDITQL